MNNLPFSFPGRDILLVPGATDREHRNSGWRSSGWMFIRQCGHVHRSGGACWQGVGERSQICALAFATFCSRAFSDYHSWCTGEQGLA